MRSSGNAQTHKRTNKQANNGENIVVSLKVGDYNKSMSPSLCAVEVNTQRVSISSAALRSWWPA